MVFNATCKNISVISWRSVLLVEETGVIDKLHDIMIIYLFILPDRWHTFKLVL
jgi:hypothetical protein